MTPKTGWMTVRITKVMLGWIDCKVVQTGAPVTFVFGKKPHENSRKFYHMAAAGNWIISVKGEETADKEIYIFKSSSALGGRNIRRYAHAKIAREKLAETIQEGLNPALTGHHQKDLPHGVGTRLEGKSRWAEALREHVDLSGEQ